MAAVRAGGVGEEHSVLHQGLHGSIRAARRAGGDAEDEAGGSAVPRPAITAHPGTGGKDRERRGECRRPPDARGGSPPGTDGGKHGGFRQKARRMVRPGGPRALSSPISPVRW